MTPSFGARLYSLLGGSATVQALIGNPARLYPQRAPQGALLPRAVYTVVSEVPLPALSTADTGFARVRVQLDAYARTYADAVTLASTLMTALATGGAAFALQTFDFRDLYEDEAECSRRVCDAVLHVKE